MQSKLVLTIGLTVLVCAGSAAHADVMDSARCKEAKAKATGKKAASLLKAFGKNEKRPNSAKLALDVSKAESKFTKGFDKAETTGGCRTTGDSDAIETKVNTLVFDIVDQLEHPPAECNCCSGGLDLLSFETGIPSGSCGVLRNFRCSGGDPDFGSHACDPDNGDADCNLGPCYYPGAGFCAGDDLIPCTNQAQCKGTCGETIVPGWPVDLECGGLYTGDGLNSLQLPLRIPDQGKSFTKVTSCDSNTGELTLGPTAAAEVGESHCTTGRRCSISGSPCAQDGDCPPSESCETRCLFGAPIPIPDADIPAFSLCLVNHVAGDASGTARCDGDVRDLSVPLLGFFYLTGDLFSLSTTPDIPGIQPCPLCDRLCQGGSKHRFPCVDDTDCPEGSCGPSPECLGGPNDGEACTPETSGTVALGEGFPTSNDCPPPPPIGVDVSGVPLALSLTTRTVTRNAVDHPEGARTFFGFCRDVTWPSNSLCFEGDTYSHCPAAIPTATGNPVPCNSDADCADADDYESCTQGGPGAFSRAASTRIEVHGSTDGRCLDDGQPHAAELVSVFPIPPTFAWWGLYIRQDTFLALPSPGVALLQGEVQLQ